MSRTSVAWDELVTAATVGTGTRPLPHTGFHPTTVAAVADDSVEADGAARLLELAAMETAANAVTVQPAAATPVEPAPAEHRTVMTDRLADLLLLAVRTDRDVATDLFETVASAGLVLPPATLPEFLELGRDSRDHAGPDRPGRRARSLAGGPRRGLGDLPAAGNSRARCRGPAPG